MSRMALITGASAGIGWELSKCFATEGWDVILVARREDKLRELAAELTSTYDVDARVEVADLANPSAVRQLHDRLQGDGVALDFLVNNAGFGQSGAFADNDPERVAAMLQLNMVSLTMLTRMVLPGMVARGRGRILNVASTAAFQPGPNMAVYCATKAYVLSFSEAIASELAGTGVTVTCLCPGATETEFAREADMEGSTIFKRGLIPMAKAEDVAREGFQACLRGQRLVVPGLSNKAGAIASKVFPRRLVTAVAGRLMAH